MKTTFKMLLLKPRGSIIQTPAAITATSGSGQSANCGAAYTNPLVATVTDAGGNPVPGVSVTFTAPASGASGTFASTGTRIETVTTNASGVATSSALTANTVSGANYTIAATTSALTANFTATNVETWANYIPNVISPLTTVEAWWRMRDTSGVTVVNSGALGAAVDLTAIAWTMAQPGQLGAGEAGLTDGATTRLQTANNATLAGLLKWEYVFLVKPSSAGEGGYGVFACWGSAINEPVIQYYATNQIKVILYNTTPTQTQAVTNTLLSTSAYTLVFVAYDNGGDRKPHIYYGVGGSVNEVTYTLQQAMTGTYRVPTNPLNIFNTTSQAATFAGLGDEVFIVNGNLTPAQRLKLVQLSGV